MTARTRPRLRGWLFAAFGAGVAALITASIAGASHFGGPVYPGHTYSGVNDTTAIYGATKTLLDIANGDQAAGSNAIVGRMSSTAAGASSAGVRGINVSTGTGTSHYGVVGSANSGTGTGVFGFGSERGVLGTSGTEAGVGVRGVHTATTGTAAGVEGISNSTASSANAIYGQISSTTPGGFSAAVRGENLGTGGLGIGVYGTQAGSGWGVFGNSPSGRGVYGSSSSGDGVVGASSSGFAGRFFGNVDVAGTLTKGGGAFRIDHPLDPAHEYLQHSFVESPDMKNVYDGVATTDANGFATVTLPRWFQALNRDYRYQLTSLSGLQNVAVAREIQNNRFTIQSEKPNSRVSWQVTGIRHDRFANAHRIQVVVPKRGVEKGRYLYPDLYGQPKSQRIGATAAR